MGLPMEQYEMYFHIGVIISKYLIIKYLPYFLSIPFWWKWKKLILDVQFKGLHIKLLVETQASVD